MSVKLEPAQHLRNGYYELLLPPTLRNSCQFNFKSTRLIRISYLCLHSDKKKKKSKPFGYNTCTMVTYDNDNINGSSR